VFEPKRAAKESLKTYIGARVTDAEDKWLHEEMKRRKLTMSDLIRAALQTLHSPRPTKARVS
jgi:hypothetical protein